MADAFIDVNLELDPNVLAKHHDPARLALELSRETAEAKCAEAHAELRTDRTPEVVVGRGVNALTGADTTLVASRWAVVIPDRMAESVDRGWGTTVAR